MKLSQITPSNVKSFVEGYSRVAYDAIIGLPYYTKEQILYRESKCDSCITTGHPEGGPMTCEHCGCGLPGKWFATKSCNGGEKFPDLMGEEEWEQYKKDNDIEIPSREK